MKYFKSLITAISLVLFLFPARVNSQIIQPDSADIQQLLQAQLDADIPGILLGIEEYSSAGRQWLAGYDDVQHKTFLNSDQTFRVASVTKTFVAVAILRLWEEGKLRLDDPITKYLCEDHMELLRKGDYDPESITIKHLLNHSSGMADHSHTAAYDVAILRSGYKWTRQRQIEALVEYSKPVGKPGERFSYSDTGYVLLGEVLEKITGLSMGEAIEQLIDFDRLGMKSTSMEAPDGDFSGRRIHQYYQGEDTYLFHPSLDYFGGGGLLSNTADLSHFMLALFNNEIFNDPATLAQMTASVSYAETPAMDYRMGIWKTQIGGLEAWTHTGFWGTQTAYFPELNLSITVNYSSRWKVKGNAPLLEELVKNLQSQQVRH